MKRIGRRNASGALDLTACDALNGVLNQQTLEEDVSAAIRDFKKALARIDCKLAERAVIIHEPSGRIFR